VAKKLKAPLKTFKQSISSASWDKHVSKKRTNNRYSSYMHPGDVGYHWLNPQIESMTKKIFEEDLPDKFQLVLTIPRSIQSLNNNEIIYLDDSKWLKAVKTSFRDNDILRYYGLPKPKYGWSGEKQSKTVSLKVEVRGSEIDIIATYKPKPRSSVIERSIVSKFTPEFPIIIYAHTEIVSNGHISTPGTKVKIEASMKVMDRSCSFSTRKYIIDLDDEVITERKTGDVKTFGNQDKFFEHLNGDL
jgi:hypothetical protein